MNPTLPNEYLQPSPNIGTVYGIPLPLRQATPVAHHWGLGTIYRCE
ncbi:hypothetical protein [Okeania sp. SIO2G5]|nr:hypothetical protein [Okeania sp. SIO2G5]